jgi:ubiquinone/menaquinone biosynthesis C-methylase UbiE
MSTHYSEGGISAESRSLHDEHLEKMRRYYQRTASQYNELHYEQVESENHNLAVKEILNLLSREPKRTLLDVACGTGRAVGSALRAGFNAEGIDLCPELLQIAEKEFKIPAEKLHCGDATKLPFADNSFDVTSILGALHHSAMPHTIVDELIRVSRHGIVVSDEANHFHGGVRQV